MNRAEEAKHFPMGYCMKIWGFVWGEIGAKCDIGCRRALASVADGRCRRLDIPSFSGLSHVTIASDTVQFCYVGLGVVDDMY